MRRFKAVVLLVLCILGLRAADARAATHTNLIYNVSIGLSSFQQEIFPFATNIVFYTVRPGRFGTASIASAIANTPLFRTNHLGDAKLLFRVSNLGPDRTAQFILRKGTNDFDVSGYLYLAFPGAAVTSKTPGPNGTTNATDRTQFELNLSGTSPGYFDVQGFCIVQNTSVFNGRDLIQAEEFPAVIAANVAGTGYADNKTTLFKGTVLLSGRRVEIKQD